MTLIYPAEPLNEQIRFFTGESPIVSWARISTEYWDCYWTGNAKRLYYSKHQTIDQWIDPTYDVWRTRKTPIDPILVNVLENWRYSGLNYCSGRPGRKNGYRPYSNGPCLLAMEPIVSGVGILRNVLVDQSMYQKVVGEAPCGKVTSDLVEKEYFIVTIDGKPTPLESTNIVGGDSYGELEQLFARRNESEFMTNYFNLLKAMTAMITDCYGKSGPRWYIHMGFGQDNMIALGETHARHLHRNNLWNKPPQDLKELLERVDYLLKNIIVDRSARTEITSYTHYNHFAGTAEHIKK